MNPWALGPWRLLAIRASNLDRLRYGLLLFVALAVSGCISPGVASIPRKALGDSYIDLIALQYSPYLKKVEFENGSATETSLLLSNESHCESYYRTVVKGLAGNAESPNALGWCAAVLEQLPHRRLLNKCECKATEPEKANCRLDARNRVIGDLLLVIDHHYEEYEGNVAAGSARRNFWFENGSGLAAGLSAVLDPTGAKTALAALASALTQVNTSVSKNFYAEMTLTVLIIRMRQDREVQVTQLRRHLLDPYSTYSMEAALLDLNRLYRAGTLGAAIQGIATQNEPSTTFKASPELAREQRVIVELAQALLKEDVKLNGDNAGKLGPGSTIESQLLTFAADEKNGISTAAGLISEVARLRIKATLGSEEKDLSALLADRLATAYQSASTVP